MEFPVHEGNTLAAKEDFNKSSAPEETEGQKEVDEEPIQWEIL